MVESYMKQSLYQQQEGGPQEKIQISISCRNLVDLDIVSVSDPIVHVYIKDSNASDYTLVGKTERIDNNLNPDFTTTFTLDYFFEKQQYLKFCVYDVDNVGQDHIGDCETTISRIMGAHRQTFVSDLMLPKNNKIKRGQIIVRGDSVKQSNDEISFMSSAILTQKFGGCCFGTDNPYLLILRSRGVDDQEFVKVHQTPFQPGTVRPQFGKEPMKIKLQLICNGEFNKNIKFEIRNYAVNGAHQVYGSIVVTINQLILTENQVFELKNDLGQQVGSLSFQQIKLVENVSFVDYLRSGWKINLAAAIDFTQSNGDINETISLHRQFQKGQLNDYEKAILSVGQIVEPYAFGQKFAAFGFGGIPRFAGGTEVSHCFNLTGKPDPTVEGLANLFAAYKYAINGTSLCGPTYFNGILRVVLDYMKANISQPMYHILLILTDGNIHDMQQTKDLIVECSKYPLSIIIVGIGHEDFSNMIELDGDNQVLRNYRGEAALRDIVQFVQFNDFNKSNDLTQLAEEVLKEVPEQLCGYMKQQKIKPQFQPLMTQQTIQKEYKNQI